jgi:hypothetical protein
LTHLGKIISHEQFLASLDARHHLVDKKSNDEQECISDQFSGKFTAIGVPIIAIPADLALGCRPGNECLASGIGGISNWGDPGRVHSISLGCIITFCGAINPGRNFTVGSNGTSTGIGSTCTVSLGTLHACRCVRYPCVRGRAFSLYTVSYLSASRWGGFSTSNINNTGRGSFNNWHMFIALNTRATYGGGSSSRQLVIVNFAAFDGGQGIDTGVASKIFSTDLTHMPIEAPGTLGRDSCVATSAVTGGKTSWDHGERRGN